MLRPIGMALTAMAVMGLTMVNVDDAQARHRRNGGGHGSCGSFGGGGSFGGVFSRNSNGGYGDSHGSNGGHGSCGSHGGAYNGGIQNGEHRVEYGRREEFRNEFDPGQPPPAPEMDRRRNDDRDVDSSRDRENEDRERDKDSKSDDDQNDRDRDNT